MALEPEKKDRSYQFGRLLAVMEKAERDTYDSGEGREPNAIRLQSIFCQRPMRSIRQLLLSMGGTSPIVPRPAILDCPINKTECFTDISPFTILHKVMIVKRIHHFFIIHYNF